MLFTCIHSLQDLQGYIRCPKIIPWSFRAEKKRQNKNADELRKFLIFKSPMESPQRFRLRQREASWQLFSAYPASSQDMGRAAFVRLRGTVTICDLILLNLSSKAGMCKQPVQPKTQSIQPGLQKKLYVCNIPNTHHMYNYT